jgi:alpha-glucosidase (family GH31 glycosyl hydrolase)
MSLSSLFSPSLQQATADEKNRFVFPGIRFTILTERFVRVEISTQNRFENRPTQQFWFRNQPLPDAVIQKKQDHLSIKTNHFQLTYQSTSEHFIPENLEIILYETKKTIHIDDVNPGVFPGTTRTLDLADGAVKLQPGFLSREGWIQIEDTASLLFNESGWLQERPKQRGYRDLYFLISGSDYKAALQDYQKISGTPPLLPRAFLGNWWSRFWPYSQEDIVNLVSQFKEKNFPFSVFIIDMDWHITQTGNQCSGWTGFSWNHDLIPQPEHLIHWLHEQNLITSMNLHPAEGIHPHEQQYTAAATAMGVEPDKKEPISFTIDDPKFTRVYFEQMLYPLEKQGVDFWWIDWQQGEKTSIKGLDPLWWLNHLHFYDLGKSQDKRPAIFSRWGGAGNQRYPIGFSGDTYITWKSLAFQPYFTATAANTAYGWWSHDIGGHMHGIEDGELYVRWLQYGALSPILRIHCSNDPWIDHLPWAFDAEIERVVRNAMQFRHALVPYLYSHSWKNEKEGLLPVTPLYYEWPQSKESYQAENQYMFGSELMAAPVVSPLIPQLKQAKQPIWFPEGDWFDFFTGEHVSGNQWQVRLYKLDEMPLFAKAGAIIPLNHDVTSNGCANPQIMDIQIFPLVDGTFELYEDDGVSQQYKSDGGCITKFQSRWKTNNLQFEILPALGNIAALPEKRTYHLHFKGIKQPDEIILLVENQPLEIETTYNAEMNTLTIHNIPLLPSQQLMVKLQTYSKSLITADATSEKRIKKFLRRLSMKPDQKREIMNLLPELEKDICNIERLKLPIKKMQKIALIEAITGVAAASLTSPTGKKHIVLCNPGNHHEFVVLGDQKTEIPKKGILLEKQKKGFEINYFDLVSTKF